ncbi:MAG: ABC transporter permease [Candidatus Tectomicrobia bacterium]|uniref:ABC transporter permease n=1 Tax=Tectimicrobiota bacterium TaxID=2528274 RepID=A0A932LZX1_UNCTE|nr:ABC transporter permease [Candidatus Tectomicrobia bacterium]
MGSLAALIKKEFIQFFRRKPLIILIVWTIAVEIAICAYSITYDVIHLRLAVQDLDSSPQSRELIARFSQTEYFDAGYWPQSSRDLDDLLESGRATVGLVIPPDFSRQLGQGLSASAQLLLDGSNSNSALIALGYATGIVRQYSQELDRERLLASAGKPTYLPAVRNQRRAWYNPALRSVDFEVVSMLTLAVMMIAVILPAAGLAWEKEAGTIEQLLVMPLRPWEIMLAKVVPTFVVSLVSLALALWVPWWFEVSIRGSLLLFFVLSVLFLFSSLGLGLLWGTLAQNLQQALLLSGPGHGRHRSCNLCPGSLAVRTADRLTNTCHENAIFHPSWCPYTVMPTAQKMLCSPPPPEYSLGAGGYGRRELPCVPFQLIANPPFPPF